MEESLPFPPFSEPPSDTCFHAPRDEAAAISDYCPGERAHDVTANGRSFGAAARAAVHRLPGVLAVRVDDPLLPTRHPGTHVGTYISVQGEGAAAIPLRMHLTQHGLRGAVPGGAFPFLAPAA